MPETDWSERIQAAAPAQLAKMLDIEAFNQEEPMDHDSEDPADFDRDALPDMGRCCHCLTQSTVRTVRNIGMLPLLAPAPGTGWGCLQCGLPNNGAIFVLCDACAEMLDRMKELRLRRGKILRL